MKPARSNKRCRRGSTLIEAVLATVVLAVAIPLVCGVLAEAGKSGLASQADTRSTWIIPACIGEIRASRDGCPRYFTPTAVGQAFPPTGEVWALAFSPDGKPLGKISSALYTRGTREIDGITARYIASMSSSPAPAEMAGAPLLPVHISLEFPASVPADQRRKLAFHTLMP